MPRTVTREDYFDAAMTVLATAGAGKLKVATLCRSLNVTTGSFYGYFGSLDGFVEQFLTHWQDRQTDRIVQLSNAPGEPEERIRLVKELARGLPHEAEAAIRGWAHINPRVATAQREVDARRQKALTKLFLPVVGSRRTASRLAIMAITLLVGLQQWRSPVSKKDYDLLFDEFESMVLNCVDDSRAT